MDFFEQQARAKRRTVWLVLVYALFVAGIVAAVHGVVSVAIGIALADQAGAGDDVALAFAQVAANPRVLLGSVGAISAIMTGVAYATSAEMASELGPVPVTFCIARRMLPDCSLPDCGATRLVKALISSQRAAKPSRVRSPSGSHTASFITVHEEW